MMGSRCQDDERSPGVHEWDDSSVWLDRKPDSYREPDGLSLDAEKRKSGTQMSEAPSHQGDGRITSVPQDAPAEYLRASPIVDYGAFIVGALAASMRDADSVLTAKRCFEWVRDEVRHSLDHGDDQVTLTASEVVSERTGLCYAKSHLLAALLRANGIPCGFVYQRLTVDGKATTFCLHGLNAVWLPDLGWYRVDPRGNRPGLATDFDPPRESLAFTTRFAGEGISERVYAEPLAVVVDSLRRHTSMRVLSQHLPDADLCPMATPGPS